MKLLFYDLETTGLDFKENGIIQFAGIIANLDTDNNITLLDKFNFNMKPPKNKIINEEALAINKYTKEQIKTFENRQKVYDKFIQILSKYCDKFNKMDKYVLVGYNNLHFDNDFLRPWFLDCNDTYFGAWFWSNSIDVMSEASRYLVQYRPALLNFKLSSVAKALDFNIDSNELHDGFYDIKLTMKIFLKLLKEPTIKPWDENEAERIFNIKY